MEVTIAIRCRNLSKQSLLGVSKKADLSSSQYNKGVSQNEQGYDKRPTVARSR